MPTAYVIYGNGDRTFIQRNVLPVLPSNGFAYWISRHQLVDRTPERRAIETTMESCEVILAVLSPALLQSTMAVEEVGLGLSGRQPLIAVQVAPLSNQDSLELPARLWAVPKVDFTVEEENESARLLAALLPTVDPDKA